MGMSLALLSKAIALFDMTWTTDSLVLRACRTEATRLVLIRSWPCYVEDLV